MLFLPLIRVATRVREKAERIVGKDMQKGKAGKAASKDIAGSSPVVGFNYKDSVYDKRISWRLY
jgi:hypothetical protein